MFLLSIQETELFTNSNFSLSDKTIFNVLFDARIWVKNILEAISTSNTVNVKVKLPLTP